MIPDNFLPKNLTVKEVVEIYSKNIDPEKFLNDEVLTIGNHTKIHSLSGGESRYLEFKLLLNLDTLFVLLDEPFNGISPLHIELLKKIAHIIGPNYAHFVPSIVLRDVGLIDPLFIFQ